VDLSEGLQLGERLRLVRPLAQGGMAHLWVAQHLTLGFEVVVKILGATAEADATGRQRLLREARLTAKVSSLHVVRLLEGEVGGTGVGEKPFLVMELLRGEDLATRIARVGRLPLGETVTVVEHIALALEKAHSMGISHRDVKPGNVFLVEGPGGMVAKLIDFGIAKDTSEHHVELTHAGSLMGTPPYMSPEQVVGARDVDSRCDLWSLSVVAYSCLTGRLPFNGDTFGAVCVAIHGGRFDPPSFTRRELSPQVDAFFARALCRTLEMRYRGARELSEAFRAATWSDASAASLDVDATLAPGSPAPLPLATTRLDLECVTSARESHREKRSLEPRLSRSGIRPVRGQAEPGRSERGRR
jgi:serine/threonine-protein kinase